MEIKKDEGIVITIDQVRRLVDIAKNEKFYTIPQGLTREEKRQFILNCAKENK